MSELKVEIVEIAEINNHPNADRLDLATIKGWQCVAQKGVYKQGDKAIYFPIDSVLPIEIETKIFGPNSKVKLSKSRVKTIKLRGAISQGLITPLHLFDIPEDTAIGTDLTKKFKITKYEPPKRGGGNVCGGGVRATKKQTNPHFRKYTSIENFKNYNKVFTPEDDVIVTEKIHGTNFRAGYVKGYSLWYKIKSFFGFGGANEFVFGSHNVQLQQKMLVKTYYDKNVYAEAVKKYDLKNKIPKNMVIYGEIYGDGIQKNYKYGCPAGEHKLVVFDMMIDGKYINFYEVVIWCEKLGLEYVPILYEGPFDLDKIKNLTLGNSVLVPIQKVREGVVIKPMKEEKCHMGRKVLKYISDDYLLQKGNTDYH